MSGQKLAQQLTRRYPSIKVLYVSGFTAQESVSYGMLDPAMPFLQKPFRPESLTRTVREVLGRPNQNNAGEPKG